MLAILAGVECHGKKKAPISLDPKPQPWKSQWERQLCDQHALKLIHPKRCKAMPYRSTRKKEKRKVLMTSRPCKCKRHCLACCDNTMMFAMPRSRTAHSSFKNRCPPASSLKPQWHPRLCKRWMRSVRAWRTSLVGGCSCGFLQRSAQLSNTRGPGTSSEAARGAAQSVSGAMGDRALCPPGFDAGEVREAKLMPFDLHQPKFQSVLYEGYSLNPALPKSQKFLAWLGCSKKASTGSTGATWAMSCAR